MIPQQFGVCIFGLTLITAPTAVSLESQLRARGLERSGRSFTYQGKPTILGGFDVQDLACDRSVDFRAAMDRFAATGLNKVRIWIHCYWRPDQFLHPWPYENSRFDLSRWNPEYWERLKTFLVAARKRDIIVEISLFHSNSVDSADDWRAYSPFNEANNVNGFAPSNRDGHRSPEFYSMRGAVWDHQMALVEKVMLETAEFQNVYYEVCNEFPGQESSVYDTYKWQIAIARALKKTGRLVGVHAHQYVGEHTTGVELYANEDSIDVLGFHLWMWDDFMPAKVFGKPLQNNEGASFQNLEAGLREARMWFSFGGSYSLYVDRAEEVFTPEWERAAKALSKLRMEYERRWVN